ncbi:MAG: putative selenium-dependent hydroxylase accessory protein YqeC [Spirochaetaceae bacterium]|jgi:probable selenium-dependent hydroxylase accessory protein YqeC|nr:putative selenium-dependent hydroxylase accessory protein YqeC [Spirochaetaceae bacterium]
MKETVRLRDFFKRYSDEVITIVGSGGKTSLLWFLARCFADEGPQAGAFRRRVLVTTTTKMGAPDYESGLFDHFTNGLSMNTMDTMNIMDAGPMGNVFPPVVKSGVTFAGCHEAGSTKTTALPPKTLAFLMRRFDGTLIEGDGSKTLPLKGWADDEPVVPPSTSVTVGVIPVWPLGMPATEAVIHRLPLFCALTGAGEGDILTQAHLAAAISGRGGTDKRRGLFAAARGKRVLFFNQVEDEDALRQTAEIMGLLSAAFKARLDAVIAGSVKQDQVTVLLSR